MKFIDLHSLVRKYEGKNKRLYVDLSSISVISVAYTPLKSAENDEPCWHVDFSTAVGFMAVKCADEQEADEIAAKVIKLVETVKVLPLKTHAAVAGDMVEKMKNL